MMRIVTFNLRCATDSDGINSFFHRSGRILKKITEEKPDIICFQEGTDVNISFLEKYLNDYQIFFNQRNEDYSGEGLAVAIKKNVFRLHSLDSFWLSDTPYLPGSRFEEQSIYPRICQCVSVKRTSDNKMFRFYNVHLDHISEQAKLQGIKAVLKRISDDYELQPFTFFIMGDFNAEPDSEAIDFCNSYSMVAIQDLTKDIETSFHNFGRNKDNCKIDYIYTEKEIADLSFSAIAWTDSADGIYLSDHYPICVEIDV